MRTAQTSWIQAKQHRNAWGKLPAERSERLANERLITAIGEGFETGVDETFTLRVDVQHLPRNAAR